MSLLLIREGPRQRTGAGSSVVVAGVTVGARVAAIGGIVRLTLLDVLGVPLLLGE
jgi:hypothetical protein